MNKHGVKQIVIGHLSGSKDYQIEHISLTGGKEKTGRDPKPLIAFDWSRDEIVGRHHAVIRVVCDYQISLRP